MSLVHAPKPAGSPRPPTLVARLEVVRVHLGQSRGSGVAPTVDPRLVIGTVM